MLHSQQGNSTESPADRHRGGWGEMVLDGAVQQKAANPRWDRRQNDQEQAGPALRLFAQALSQDGEDELPEDDGHRENGTELDKDLEGIGAVAGESQEMTRHDERADAGTR